MNGQQCKISSWRSSRFVMWVPPNHLLNPIRLLFILLWGAVSIFFLEEGKQIHISSGCPSRDIWTVGQPWMWQTGPAKLGGDHHRCHRAANLHQVWVGNHHQTVAEAHRPVVGAGSGPPLGLHRRQVLPSQTQPCATARKGAHPGGVSAWKFHRYACSVACETLNLPMIIHSHDRDASEAPRSTRCGKRRGGRGRSAGGRWEQRGEERPVKRNCL